MTIRNLKERFINGEITVLDYTKELLGKIEVDKCNTFITVNSEEALKRSAELDLKLKNNEEPGELFGVAVSLKDNIMTEGLKTTCASKMLENYIPSYDATIVKKLMDADAIIIGKTNMDEFAMGGSSETSYFGPVNNPIDNTLIPGGSSSGAAAAQKLGYSVVSLGSDTGGSVRQPASYCSLLGYLPSYGSISRYGVVSLANSLDQVGIFGDSVEDIVSTINVIGGHDQKDPTSMKQEINLELEDREDLRGLKIAYVYDFEKFNIDEKVLNDYNEAINTFIKLGAELTEIKFENREYFSPTYSVINTAEASSNLSRFDGIRYGFIAEDYEGVEELYVKTRSEGFGEEVQRRIAIGMYYLGSEFEREIYERAIKVRTKIKNEIASIFKDYDLILTPSTPDLPAKLGGEKGSIEAFNSGDYHVIVNLTGSCAISIPMNEGLGGSVQLIADRFEDELLLNIADRFYKEVK